MEPSPRAHDQGVWGTRRGSAGCRWVSDFFIVNYVGFHTLDSIDQFPSSQHECRAMNGDRLTF